MSMLSLFVPKEECASVFEMDLDGLLAKQMRGIVFDIDNTLVPHGHAATQEIVSFVATLKEKGFSVCLISNNHEERVRPFAKAVDCFAVWDAGKPLKKAYQKALNTLKTTKEETVFVGDQLFTDLMGANCSGLYSILVKPIDITTDPPFVRFKRVLEKPIFRYVIRKRG